jgi:oxygen-independent coproporphyrinogen-3 oxidase
MQISVNLLEKYNIPVPRYTSYPPANHFRDGFKANSALEMIDGSNQTGSSNIAIYIHIPFCRRMCHYCGCNSYPIGSGDSVSSYVEALKNEIRLVSRHLDKNRKVSQIHYGGGTPNTLEPGMIKSINELLFTEFSLINDPEIAIECNPAGLDFGYADMLLSSGFNRFSLGIQDFNQSVLKLVNREQAQIDPEELVKYFRSKDKRVRINLDFIYGLPGQTIQSFSGTIEKAAAMRPDRLVTFSYAHVPWVKKNQSILEKYGFPSAEEKIGMFLKAREILWRAGYETVGLDHYVLPGDDLSLALRKHQLMRNFQGYCTKRTTGQVYAFGVSSISQLETGYFQNTRDIGDYISTVNSGSIPVEKGYLLAPGQKIIRDLINELMCNLRIKLSVFAERAGLSYEQLKLVTGFEIEDTRSFENDGLLNTDGDEIIVTEAGTLFIRNIASIFDRELKESRKKYSNPL